MIKNRIYQNRTLSSGLTVELDQRAAHHLRQVLRLRADDEIGLFNGDGQEYAGRLRFEGKRVLALIGDRACTDTPPPLSIELVQSVSRGDRMDWTIQKAVELGVSRISPVYSERSIKPLDEKRRAKKLQHWHGVIVSACEQSGRCRLPVLEPPQPLADYLNQRDTTVPGLVPDPAATRPMVRTLAPCKQLAILIGPEGGWAAGEVEAAVAVGFTAVTLGPRILRTETAGLAALAVVQSHLGDLT